MKINFVSFFLNKRNETFQTRMLIALNFLGFIITLSIISAALILKEKNLYTSIYISVAIMLVSALFCELALHEKTRKTVHYLTVFLFPFVYIPLSFFIAGSITLPVSPMLFFIIMLLNFIGSKRERYIVNAFIFIFITAFTYIEFSHPHHLPDLPRSESVLKWWITIMPAMVLMSIILATLVLESFRREQRTLTLQQQQLEQKNIILENQTREDSLTGLHNKKYLNEQLNSYINLAQRQHFPLSLIVADIDFFKKYNDHYGHIQGDICLTQVAQILKASVGRKSDNIFRFGGEEFVILLPFTDTSGSIEIAERIINNINEEKIEHAASEIDDHITLSLGITTYNSEPDINSNELIRIADKALYRMKHSGRNGYSISH